MVFDYAQALAARLPQQSGNIAAYWLENGERVWVRKAGKRIAKWRYALLGLFAHGLHLEALEPVPHPGGRAVIATEAARLQALAALDVRVPRLLAQAAEGLMFSHLGEETLLTAMERDGIARWQQGLDAIGAVHARGGYLSEAFARNMLLCDDGAVGFIDFEEDPGQLLSFTACASRDYLCYLHSTLWLLQAQGTLADAARRWRAHTGTLPPEVLGAIEAAVRPLRWMRALHHPRWGRDTLRTATLAAWFDGLWREGERPG